MTLYTVIYARILQNNTVFCERIYLFRKSARLVQFSGLKINLFDILIYCSNLTSHPDSYTRFSKTLDYRTWTWVWTMTSDSNNGSESNFGHELGRGVNIHVVIFKINVLDNVSDR